MKNLALKKQEHRRIEAGHLWVFSNEIDVAKTPLSDFENGECVVINTQQGKKMGIGYINPQALLCVRLLTRNCDENIDTDFFIRRFKTALALRERFYRQPFYRLIHADSDLLPGLIIDRYDSTFVVQINTAGMENLKDFILSGLINLFNPTAIILRNDNSAREKEGLKNLTNEVAFGEAPNTIKLTENDAVFEISLLDSQKTGWYFDQAFNRKMLKSLVQNKRVLDVYSYMGGFGVLAAMNAATEVVCIDSSAKAIQAVETNARINQVSSCVKTIMGDAFEEMKKLHAAGEKFDVVLLDPPAFIRKRKDRPKGTKAYQRINELALQLLTNDAILITSSCSMHMPRETLIEVVQRAAVKNNSLAQIIAIGHQAPDHPIHPAIPETNYLKTLFCRVCTGEAIV
jgi:23S rRNA (cytosine1962-C5)-methyltransferase